MSSRIRTKLAVLAVAALSPLVFLADRVIPKRQDLWVFGLGRPNQWHGNSQAVYLQVRDRSDIDAVVVARRVVPRSLDPARDRIFTGWRTLWPMLRGGVIIVHHGAADLPFTGISPRGRQIVYVGHGIPLKGILYTGWDQPTRRAAREIRHHARTFTASTCSSDIDRLSMSASLHLPLGSVWVTGLPRNDWLLAHESDLPTDVADALSRLRTELDGRRLVLYAPTFRDEGSGIYPFTAEERAELGSLLHTHNAVLGLRTHMNESGAAELASEAWALDVSPTRFPETQAVLRCTDVLVSDYSSIWIDFLLLDRPIVGFAHDLAAYTAGRHILYDLDLTYGSGPLVTDVRDFIGELDNALAGRRSEEHADSRSFARRLFHRYSDAGATARTVQHILGKAESRHAE